MASFASLNDEDENKSERRKLIRNLNSDSKSGSPYTKRRNPQDVREAIKLYSIYVNREPSTSLSKAVCDDDIETVQACIGAIKSTEGKGLDDLDKNGFTALHYAAHLNKSAIVDLLLASGADIDVRGDLGMTALLLACKHGCEQSAITLLKNGADSSLSNKQGCSALHFAALSGNENIVKKLLKDDKIKINAADTRKAIPLYNACSMGHEEICQLLLEHGSQLDSITVDGYTPLHAAAKTGNVAIVKLLLEKAIQSGYNLKELLQNKEYKYTVLHSAVRGGNLEAVKLLLSKGAEAVAEDHSFVSLLHEAAYDGNQEMIEILIAEGVNVDIRDKQNQTPLHSACSLDRVEAIKVLRNNGAKLDLKDKTGMTPFLSAVDAGNQASAALLLRLGSDPKARDNRHRTCFHVAVENEDVTMLQLLLEETGSELLNTRDTRGRTPLHYAALSRKHAIIDALLSECNAFTLSLKDERQKTPLHLAAESNKHKIVRKILYACVNNAHEVDEMGRLPLHYAAMTGRSKVCSTLLSCQEEINCLDNDQWSPLLWAAKSGNVDTVQLLLEKGAASNTCDIQGNTALHVASFHGHLGTINLLLDYGVEILVNNDGLNCLDYAIENELQLAARALVQHERWKEIFQCRGGRGKNLLSKLIETCPAAAEIVFDQCVQRSNNPRSIDYTVTYDFRLLDPGPGKNNGPRHGRFFGLWELLNQKQDKLLSHPLPKKLLCLKWNSFGLPVFVLNYTVYLVFVVCLTIFMLVQRRGARFQGSIFKDDIDDFKSANYFNTMVNFVGLVFLLINMIKELYEMYLKRLRYFTELQNLVDWTVYITGFLFLLAFAAQIRALKKNQLAWQLGTVCIFLAYMNLILQTRIFRHLGLYVTMFIEVVKTLVRVFAVFMMFILAYSLVFYILFKEQEPFKTFGKSVVKTTVMTIGEMDYTNMLIDGLGQSNNRSGVRVPLVPFPRISNTFFYIFMLTMPIVLMNLLIGLAVGDIELIRKTADLRKIAAQIEFLKQVESRYPRIVARWFYVPEYSDKPNCRTTNRLRTLFFGSDVSMDYEEEEELSSGKDLLQRYITLDKKVGKTKQQVKSVASVLEKQTKILAAISTKFKLDGDETL